MSESPIAFEIDGVAYQARRMDIFTQMAIALKLSPLLAGGLAHALHMAQRVLRPDEVDLPPQARAALALSRILDLPKVDLLDQIVPLAGELAKVPEADQRFVIMNTLAVVQKNAGTRDRPQWTSIWPAGMHEAAFPEFRTDFFLTLRVVGTVLAATLGPFSSGSR